MEISTHDIEQELIKMRNEDLISWEELSKAIRGDPKYEKHLQAAIKRIEERNQNDPQETD